jgi:hypothetical protein
MGNTQTTDGSNKSLKQIVDFVATNYILTQNFQDMRKLSDMKYCNKLVILTSKVIANKLNDIEVEYLAQRTKDGQEINVMATDKLKILNKNDLQNLDVKVETDKRRLCIGIAKYYVKIAHIYAAIVTTIKPNYVYTEGTSNIMPMNPVPMNPVPMNPVPMSNDKPMPAPISNIPLSTNMPKPINEPMVGGAEAEVALPQKQAIPVGATVKVKINNICSNRLNALLNNQDLSGESLIIKPNFCKMNLDSGTNKSRSLASEPGIPELMNLYYNKYDYDRGGFSGFKSKEQLKSGEVDMQAVYLKDVKDFYKVFTGEEDVPATVTTFSDIPLKAYHLSPGCQANGPFTTAYKGTVKDKLFKTYADHTRKMLKDTEDNQNKLLAIIDQLFVFNVNPVSKEREVTIKMGLTEKALSDIVEETRKIIVNLYIKCEQDFLTGLEIFEAIVENQIKDTTPVQAAELQSIIDAKMGASDDYKEPVKVYEEKKENINLNIQEKAKVEPVPAVVNAPAIVNAPAVVEPVVIGPALIVPAEVKGPVVIEPVAPVVVAPAVVAPVVVNAPLVSAPLVSAPLVSAPLVSAPLEPSFLDKAKIYLPSFVKGGSRRY